MTRCSGMFAWNKITVPHSCSFDDAVQEAFRLFSNVPEIKENQKNWLNLLLTPFLDCLQLPWFTHFFKLSVDRPNTTHKGRTISKVMGGGGRGRSAKKKIFAQGKIKWKKIHGRQLTLKIFMLWPKKHSYKEFGNEKKSLRLENSPPPPP